ncbi:MAG: sugar phosphate isomerase/epimerase [Planctomycetota bacterium]|nr:MAG: sugar phosphate isomerase/epimerase [Planctomycetota bacterium]
MQRRDFLRVTTTSAAGLALVGCSSPSHSPEVRDEHGGAARDPDPQPETPTAGADPLFSISLAQWSLHRALKGGRMDNLDFPRITRERFDIDAVEYVNQFFMDKPRDKSYIADLRQRCDDHGVTSLLIMCDGLGELGNRHGGRRSEAIENHKPWVGAAHALGCHSIRVNAASDGTYEEQQRLAADGLGKLAEYADQAGLNVIVENHGGLSSNGAWLAGVMQLADHPRLGTLPDFGNFCLDWSRRDEPDAWYDRYQGVAEMMPYAKAVSAKSHDFDADGNETNTDYRRMMKIVLDAGYRGRVGIEYEGENLGEDEGILATKRLLERVRAELRA